jgi:bifunctional DNA-binding transcriptional regulator/antitoxin component of YhaV-PrlF toxin-antitoxin module
MSNKYITTVQQYGDTEDFFVEIPDEICKELNWKEGDIIDWKTDDKGIILSKVEDTSSTQKEYHESYYNSESEGKDTHYWYKAKEEAIQKYAS